MRVRAAHQGLPLLAIVAALPLLAQTAQAPAPVQNAAELTSHDAPATFSTKVNLVMVPVVVRDSKGTAIGTLQKEDFQLFDKGKPQIIARFSVEKAGESAIPAAIADDASLPDSTGTPQKPASPIAQRFVAYMFDDVHTTNADLMVARKAADRHLAEKWDATTRAAIFTTSGQGNVDFTDDRSKLHEALMRLMAHPSLSGPSEECPDISYYWADQIFNKQNQTALQAAITMTMGNCTPAPANNSQQAIQEAIQLATNAAQSTASQIVSKGERDTRLAFVTLENAIRRLAAAPGERTLIFVSGGFFFADDLRWEESQIMDRAIRANVRISSLNARGLYALVPGGDASTPTPFGGTAVLNAVQQYQQESALVEEGILAELAAATGGRYFHNDNGLKEGFDLIASPPEFTYLLGFSPQNLKFDGAYHALKVKLVTARGLDVQARRGYYAPRQSPNPEEDAKREIQEAMFSRDELQDIPVDLHMQFFKLSDVSAKVAVLARVNLRGLHFRKADGRNNDDLLIVSGVFDRNGNFITGQQKTLQMHLLDTTLEKLLNSGVTVRTNFDVPPGSYVVRLVVRDSEGRTMAARNGVVEIP